MSHDEFTKLFSYMELKFGAIDKRFDKVEGDIRDIKFELAELSSRVEDHYNEFLALDHKFDRDEAKVDRQERWVHEIADHTSTLLSPA